MKRKTQKDLQFFIKKLLFIQIPDFSIFLCSQDFFLNEKKSVGKFLNEKKNTEKLNEPIYLSLSGPAGITHLSYLCTY